MATCNAGHGCSRSCSGGCGCAYVHSTKECFCFCAGDNVSGGGLRLSMQAKVTISVSKLPLGQFAAHLDGLLEREVLVPAARAQKPIALRLEGVSMSAAIKALGLSTQKPPVKSKARA